MQPQNPVPRVQVRPLVMMIGLALLLPVALAFVVDALLGTSPVAVIVVSVVCIPLTTVLVINRTMREMNALIAVVAPEEVESLEIAQEDVAESAATGHNEANVDKNSPPN